MKCAVCERVRANPHLGEYANCCLSCEMRGYARSTLAHDAVKTRSTAAIRDALALSHPNHSAKDLLGTIWDWWRLDHQNGVKA